jgi:hypothetical protein
MSDIVPNIYTCTNSFSTLVTYYNYSALYQVEYNQTWLNKAFNWTNFVSGPFADGYGNCTQAGYRLIDYSIQRNTRFGSVTDWLMSFV